MKPGRLHPLQPRGQGSQLPGLYPLSPLSPSGNPRPRLGSMSPSLKPLRSKR